MYFIDTHCHLDLFEDNKFADLIEQEKIYTIAVTNTPSVFFFTQNQAKNKKFIRAALGLHPQLASERAKEILLFKELIHQTRYVGEIGLDNNKGADFEIQKQVFEKIIDICAQAGNKILSIHSRGAEEEVIEIIGRKFPGKVILHWYSGGLKPLEKALEFGFNFSVNFSMSKNQNGSKIINSIPINRLLTESDGPFQKINSKNNASPLDINQTIKAVSLIRNMHPDDLKKQVYQNFFQLLS